MQRTHRPVCGYSDDTEILTRGGWARFSQLTYMDEVATRSQDGRFEWQRPSRITVQPYSGEMVWLHSRTADLLVTPAMPVLYMERQRVVIAGLRKELPPVERQCAAESVIGKRLSLVATSRWEPANPDCAVRFVPTRAHSYGGRLGNKGLEFTASAEDFAAFMGMWLAEGHLGKPGYVIGISQKRHGRGFAEYQDLLDRMLSRRVPHFASGVWHFCNKGLYEFLRTCGGYAWTKRVPPEVLDLGTDALEQFWRFYALGDGTVMNAGTSRKPLDVISTTSPHIAGAMQEILQKLGGWGMLQAIDFSKYDSKLGAASRLTYRLVRRAGTVAFASYIDRIPYAGLTGSVSVDAPAIYVRRNYRPVWSGAAA